MQGSRSRLSRSLRGCSDGSQDDSPATLATSGPLVARGINHGLDDRLDRSVGTTSRDQHGVRCSCSAMPRWLSIEF